MNFAKQEQHRERPARILLLGSQMATGGAQKVLLTLASFFFEHGCDVCATFFFDREGLQQKWENQYNFPIQNMNAWSKKRSSRFIKPFLFFKGLLNLLRFMFQKQFDSILTFTHHSNLIGLPLAWLARIPIRLGSHHGRIHGIPRWQEILHAWMINSQMASGMVAVSQYVQQQSVNEGIRPEKIIPITNGLNLPKINPTDRSRIRQELAIKENIPLVLSVGRLTYEKGHTFLMQAVPNVLEHFPQTMFVLVGDGPLRVDLTEEVKKLGIQENVLFLGFRYDIFQILSASDIFVLPSRSEGLPLVLLEAIGMGVPTVSFCVGGVGEIIQNGHTGLLIPPEDPAALAESIISLLDDETNRSNLSKAGQKMLAKKFSLESMCEKYANLLMPISK
jgi:glycosyltransferase involved in cell wall biosynthesis